LPLAPFQPFQLAVKVFFFALMPFLLLGDTRAQIADLRLGLISQPQRLVLRIQDDLLLLGTGGFQLQARLVSL